MCAKTTLSRIMFVLVHAAYIPQKNQYRCIWIIFNGDLYYITFHILVASSFTQLLLTPCGQST